jgi:hypothetical protein
MGCKDRRLDICTGFSWLSIWFNGSHKRQIDFRTSETLSAYQGRILFTNIVCLLVITFWSAEYQEDRNTFYILISFDDSKLGTRNLEHILNVRLCSV